MQLSEPQREAVDFYTGCCNVIASAGSGKTRVLVNRIVKLIESYGVEPENILAITFSKKAKDNMAERLKKMIPEYVGLINIETFHSFGYKIIRRFMGKNFEILDADWKKIKIIEEIYREIYCAREISGMETAAILHYISVQKNQMKEPDVKEKYGKFYKEYENYKSLHNQLDFDDMLTKCCEILRENKEGLEYCREKYQFILADEMQDTNAVQYEILKLIGAKYKNVFIVDDPLQCWDGENQVKLKNGFTKKIKDLQIGDYVETAYEERNEFFPVTNIASSVKKETLEIIVESGESITVTKDHKFFVGTPYFAGDTWYLYLTYGKKDGFRLGITKDDFTRTVGVERNSERLWVIGRYNDKDSAAFREEMLSFKYRIPTLPRSNINERSCWTKGYSAPSLNGIKYNGFRFLEDFNMDFNFPNYVAQDFTDKRNSFTTIKLTSNIAGVGNLVTYERRLAKEKNIKIKRRFANYQEAYNFAYYLLDELNADMVAERMLADGNCLFNAVCATNLTPEMEILVSANGRIVPKRIAAVNLSDEERKVFDIEVAHTGNMIANGVVSHNCIYGWRGSDNKFVLEFDREWPNAKIIQLNKNYRSSSNIVHTANFFARCIPESEDIHYTESIADKGVFKAPVYQRFFDETAEASKISKKIKELVKKFGYRYKDIAILARTNAQLQYFETAMYQNEIPYEMMNGTSFIDRKEIKLVLSYLRLVCDVDDDETFEYIYNRPNRFLGNQFLRLVKQIARKEKISLYRAIPQAVELNWRYKNAGAIRDVIERLKDKNYSAVSDIINDMRQILDLDSYVSKNFSENDDGEIDNLNTLQNIASKYKNVNQFLLFMLEFAKRKKASEDSVRLMTIHKSKGLEFPVVFIAGINQGLLPHEKNDDLDEEKRLMYVAITRAEKELYLSSTRFYNNKEMKESEFIKFLPKF